jgi:hypothetical protein
MGLLARLKSLLREIGRGGKGLLWRNFLMSIALRRQRKPARFAYRGWIRFKG